ncbi:MAG: LLM class F420-dependent oxidoreductase [Deltaproteobacteria bacterium]|nr:LLM class F420-dependent oxidoreductase [Deltaproteobacteria bacterium]
MELGSLGVWYFTETMDAPQAGEFASRLEGLGYAALWLPETLGRNPFAHAAYLFTQTERLVLATGIANIYHRHPGMTKQSQYTLAEQSGDRFLLGIGVSHAPLVAGVRGLEYGKPVAAMRAYLEVMEASPYSSVPPAATPRTVIAALGPKMLALAAEKADGAHPYWTTPEHTAMAREILGPDKMLCVEQKVCLEVDRQKAREAARQALAMYAGLPNYANNWKRLGFDDDDIAHGGSDALIDALVAWGDEEAIRDRVKAHRDAGASHVCIQPLKAGGAPGEVDWKLLEALAPRA